MLCGLWIFSLFQQNKLISKQLSEKKKDNIITATEIYWNLLKIVVHIRYAKSWIFIICCQFKKWYKLYTSVVLFISYRTMCFAHIHVPFLGKMSCKLGVDYSILLFLFLLQNIIFYQKANEQYKKKYIRKNQIPNSNWRHLCFSKSEIFLWLLQIFQLLRQKQKSSRCFDSCFSGVNVINSKQRTQSHLAYESYLIYHIFKIKTQNI